MRHIDKAPVKDFTTLNDIKAREVEILLGSTEGNK